MRFTTRNVFSIQLGSARLTSWALLKSSETLLGTRRSLQREREIFDNRAPLKESSLPKIMIFRIRTFRFYFKIVYFDLWATIHGSNVLIHSKVVYLSSLLLFFEMTSLFIDDNWCCMWNYCALYSMNGWKTTLFQSSRVYCHVLCLLPVNGQLFFHLCFRHAFMVLWWFSTTTITTTKIKITTTTTKDSFPKFCAFIFRV